MACRSLPSGREDGHVENELVLAGEPERAALRRLLELYRDYFSERGDADVGQHG